MPHPIPPSGSADFRSPAAFPAWVGMACAAWLVVWIPAYWHTWGAANFLHICDTAVMLTCIGLWRSNALLLSSQAVASIVGDMLWTLDVLWRLLAGRNLLGGTEYMWDAHIPLGVRALSLFHVVLPLILVWAVRRTGYDRRGVLLQSAIGAALLIAARFTPPDKNINFAFMDPLFHHSWSPIPLHLAVIFAGFLVIAYLPAHCLLARLFSAPSAK